MGSALTLPATDWQAADWQRLWISIWGKKRPWRSLAIVPAGPGVAPSTITQIGITLANAGSLYVTTPIHVADASGIVHPQQVNPFSNELARYLDTPALVVLVLPALRENPNSLALARAADCALLCIVRGEMANADAKKTVAQIGAPHFIGSAMFCLATQDTDSTATGRRP
jgi:hypothetical protein